MSNLQSILCAQCGEVCKSPENEDVIRVACTERCVQAWLDEWAPGMHTVPIAEVPVVTGRAKRFAPEPPKTVRLIPHKEPRHLAPSEFYQVNRLAAVGLMLDTVGPDGARGNWTPIEELTPGTIYDFADPLSGKVGQCWMKADGKWGQEPLGNCPVVLCFKKTEGN